MSPHHKTEYVSNAGILPILGFFGVLGWLESVLWVVHRVMDHAVRDHYQSAGWPIWVSIPVMVLSSGGFCVILRRNQTLSRLQATRNEP